MLKRTPYASGGFLRPSAERVEESARLEYRGRQAQRAGAQGPLGDEIEKHRVVAANLGEDWRSGGLDPSLRLQVVDREDRHQSRQRIVRPVEKPRVPMRFPHHPGKRNAGAVGLRQR